MTKVRPTIFAVDDNPSNITLLEHLLSDIYQIVTFYNPAELLEHCNHEKADLVLSDLVMPQMDGIELLKKIKINQPDIPFIILSAYDEPPDIARAYKYGAKKYIIKPINIPELFLEIERAMKHH